MTYCQLHSNKYFSIKFHWKVFIDENAFENVVCKMAAFCSRYKLISPTPGYIKFQPQLSIIFLCKLLSIKHSVPFWLSIIWFSSNLILLQSSAPVSLSQYQSSKCNFNKTTHGLSQFVKVLSRFNSLNPISDMNFTANHMLIKSKSESNLQDIQSITETHAGTSILSILTHGAWWPIWRHGTRSKLAQVMACCLTAPSLYLNQCWLIIPKVQWCSSEGNFAWDITAICH